MFKSTEHEEIPLSLTACSLLVLIVCIKGGSRGVLVFLKFGPFSCELKETESSGPTESEV